MDTSALRSWTPRGYGYGHGHGHGNGYGADGSSGTGANVGEGEGGQGEEGEEGGEEEGLDGVGMASERYDSRKLFANGTIHQIQRTLKSESSYLNYHKI